MKSVFHVLHVLIVVGRGHEYTIKVYGWVELQLHSLLIPDVVIGEWRASCPGRFTAGLRAHGTHWIGGRVDPRDRLDNGEEKHFLSGIEPQFLGCPSHSLFTLGTSLLRLAVVGCGVVDKFDKLQFSFMYWTVKADSHIACRSHATPLRV